jgi:4-aminobutyrate aminotransferase-like enzyme
VIEEEGLQAKAARVGAYLMERLSEVAAEYEFMGDVRGMGLMIGIEMVTDAVTKRHAPKMARCAAQQLCHCIHRLGLRLLDVCVFFLSSFTEVPAPGMHACLGKSLTSALFAGG